MGRLEDRVPVEVENATQPHCATVLVLDTSGSMDGPAIEALNEGIAAFKDEVMKDELARVRVDLAIVTFGSAVNVHHEFSSVECFSADPLVAGGSTPMGGAIIKALDMVEDRTQQYKSQGVDYYRPWVFVLTDGAPTDMSSGDSLFLEVQDRIHRGERDGKFMLFAVGVGEADFAFLTHLASPARPPLRLKASRFKDMFQWLSRSQVRVSAAGVGSQVAIENPTNANGWGEIPAA